MGEAITDIGQSAVFNLIGRGLAKGTREIDENIILPVVEAWNQFTTKVKEKIRDYSSYPI